MKRRIGDYSADQPRDDHGRFDAGGGAADRAGAAAAGVFGAQHSHNVHETHSTARVEGHSSKVSEASVAAEKSLKAEGFKSKGISSSQQAITSRFAHPDGRQARVVTEIHGSGSRVTVRAGTSIPTGKANFAGRARLNDGFSSHVVSVGDNGLVFACDVTEISSGIFSKRTIDASTGFMKMPAVMSRTGVQPYLARELGLDHAPYNLPSSQVVRLNRPADEVFAPDSLRSFENQTVAIDHPKEPVSARNWKTHAVGDVRDVHREDRVVAANIIIKDKKGMDALESGKKYLSAGYSFELDMTPGRTSAGDTFDGVQRTIRGNHVALVNNPRGGPACKVADSTGEELMRVVTVDGIPVNVDDTGVAVLEKFIAGHDKMASALAATVKVGDATFKLDDPALPAAIATVVTARDEAIAKVKTPEQIEAIVTQRVKVVGDAKALVPAIVTDQKTDAAIQREVIASVVAKDEAAKKTVDAILAGKTIEAADEAVVNTAFNVLVATGAGSGSGGSRTANDAALGVALVSGKKQSSATEVVDSGTELVGRAAMIARQNGTLKA